MQGDQKEEQGEVDQQKQKHEEDDEAPQCGLIEDDFDYNGNDLYVVDDVVSAATCCAICAAEPQCQSWTWGKKRGEPYSDKCFLKNAIQPNRRIDGCCTSGLPQELRVVIIRRGRIREEVEEREV